MTTAEVVGMAILVMNASALIWGAAKIAGTVENLKDIVGELNGLVKNVNDTVHGAVARIAVLEERTKD